jgi:hypothetical protein
VALGAAQWATAQNAPQTSGEEPLAQVVVTGSLIKRTDTETPSPVQVISEKELLDSGYRNVSDVLRTLSANGQGTLNQGFGQAFASGGSGIALRGLTVGDTLTLIDSERMVAYPLSDDGERSFVDVSAIPFNAIESVEVLKDGASAVRCRRDRRCGQYQIEAELRRFRAHRRRRHQPARGRLDYARGRDTRLGRSCKRRLQRLHGHRLASSG